MAIRGQENYTIHLIDINSFQAFSGQQPGQYFKLDS